MYKSALARFWAVILVLAWILFPNNSTAQQLRISDFVLFGGTSNPLTGQTPCSAPGYSVQLASSTNIQGGSIGSYRLVTSTGNITVNGNIYSGGLVQLANNNNITGKIAAANSTNLSGTILSVGSGANLANNIDVNGNIVIGGGTVSGFVTHPTGTTYSGPNIGTRNITGPPALPGLPPMPAITVFPAYGTTNITSTQTITPGTYKDVNLGGNTTLTLSGPGTYIFKSLKTSGPNTKIVFNFQNSTTGNFLIYVYGDIVLKKTQTSMINGGSATRIYTETHGNGSEDTDDYTVAFNMTNGSNGTGNMSNWLGSVWAPYAAIKIGSGNGPASSVTGALWSGTQVNILSSNTINFAPFLFCTPPDVNAGPDRAFDFTTQTTLTGTSSTAGVSFSWQAINGGTIASNPNAATITITSAGTYILTATQNADCFAKDTVEVTSSVKKIIGSELTSIFQNYSSNAPASPFFVIADGYILIDVIVNQGYYNTVLNLLQTAPYGLRNPVTNGQSQLIITGEYPIVNLQKLNLLTTEINYCRPFYQPILFSATGDTTTGLVVTAGDTTMRTYLVRSGYKINGDGIKIGVISDSYGTITSGTTATLPLQPVTIPPNPTPQTFTTNTFKQDIVNGDLPGDTLGFVNPNGFLKNVHVLQDYPLVRSDEGRAMLQIIHDVAPGAELYFRTGFFTAGDFAAGIQELKQAGCNVIVDDVTYITEPFLKDGTVATAVNTVTAQGVSYFSAAGNFANRSYEKDFNPVDIAPLGFTGKKAHNFGGGDLFQHVKLAPGNYTIVLQWVDDIYSFGETGGTKNDLDIYLTPNTDGTGLIGFNRDNTNGDPIEFIPITINGTDSADYNIFIVNNTSTSNPSRIKYIVFKGGIRFMEFNEGTSTLVGQANADSAMAVGAARYDKAPPFITPPLIESFSSTGGTKTNGVVRQKPDFVAPDGVNTTVKLGQDYPNTALDGYSNFFGTSAAAPHAAAVAALIMEGRKKFLGRPVTTPSEIRSLLQLTAVDMETSQNLPSTKFDYISGFGLLNVDSAMRTFAAPTPYLIDYILPPQIIPGHVQFDLTITGQNFSNGSKVLFGNDTIPSTLVNANTIMTNIGPFDGNPEIKVYTPSKQGTNGTDGGFSNSLFFFDADITVSAVNIVKKYGQQLPALDTVITINGVLLQDTTLTLADIGLDNMTLTTAATTNSNVGTYLITPARAFDIHNPRDSAFLVKYNYKFNTGTVTVEKMPLKVTPNDITTTYGQPIGNITFKYEFDQTNVADVPALTNQIKAYHEAFLPNNALAVIKDFSKTQANGSHLTTADLVNLNMIATFKAVNNSRKFKIEGGRLVPLTNPNTFNVQYIVDVASESIFGYKNDPSKTVLYNVYPGINSKGLLGAYSLTSNTTGNVEVNGSLVQMVNGSLVQMVNSATGPMAPVLNGSLVQMVNGQLSPVPNGSLVQLVNGSLVQLVNGEFVALPNGSLVQLVNGSLVQMVNGSLQQLVNGSLQQLVNGSLVQLVNGSLVQLVNGVPVPIPNGSLVQLVNGSLVQMVNGSLQQLVNGSLQQLVNGSLVQLVNGSLVQLVNSNTIGAGSANNNTAVIIDRDDATPSQNNWLGAMFGINMITGMDVGQQSLIPGILVNSNFDITYGLGTVHIQPLSITITPNTNQSKVYGNADPAFTYTSSETLQIGDSFSGALGRAVGKNAGTYAYTLGTLSAGNNYTLTLGGANTFAITARPITITPTAGQSKVYGDADPVFTYTASEVLQSGDIYSGALGRAPGNNVGTYSYTPGTLTAGSNYLLTLGGTNKFTITAAPLTVKASDKVIFKGDSLPTAVSTITITGLKNGDNPTPAYDLSPTCSGNAGVYTIIPKLSGFANSVNYMISYINGILYINPKGTGADDVDTYLDCVEDRGASYLPQNRRYVAHFYSKNTNPTPVYVPVGVDNKLSSTGSFDGSQQAVLFLPGTGSTRFNVPFDGISLKWELKTYEGNTKVTESVTASASSKRTCTYSTSARLANTNTTAEEEKDTVESTATEIVPAGGVNVFPNPARDRAAIYMAGKLIMPGESLLFDTYGRSYPVRIIRQVSKHAFEIDLSRLASGLYFIRVKINGGYRTVSIIKS
jgi:hypothetical protein